MTTPGPKGCTFIAANGTITPSKAAVPMRRRELQPTSKPADVAREFNNQAKELHEATLDARSLPFGGPKTVVSVAFTSGIDQRVAHRLGTSRIIAILGIGSVPTVGTATASVVSVDDTAAVLRPTGTFTAPVFFMVTP